MLSKSAKIERRICTNCGKPVSISDFKSYMNMLPDNISDELKIKWIWESLLKHIYCKECFKALNEFQMLEKYERDVLTAACSAVGRKIPLCSDMRYSYRYGFVVENNHVTQLGLCSCELTHLESLIKHLSALKFLFVLNLAENKLATIPESIDSLTSLKSMNLNVNKLTTITRSIGFLHELENLSAGVNNLETFPQSIGNLSNLLELNLGGNNLTILPDSIGNLSSLEKLNLKCNNLQYLPDSIGNLTSLKYLNLYLNYLETLPESIGNLKSLRYFYLDKNNLQVLPKSIYTLSLIERKLPKCPFCIRKSSRYNWGHDTYYCDVCGTLHKLGGD